MLFDFLYSLLNAIMATATIARQEEDLEEVAEMNEGGKGGELKENKEKCKMKCHHQNGQNGGEMVSQKLNGNENELKVNEEEETKEKETKNTTELTVNDWDYDESGQCGPQNWLKICGCEHLGDFQSPIDFQLSKMRILSSDNSPFCLVNYKRPLLGELLNTGCSIQFVPDSQVEPPEIYGGKLDQNYRFIQYHFHWAQNDNEGSEHTIGGLRYPAELHLVHKGVQDPNKLAVLGIFLKLDDARQNGREKKFVFDAQEMDALKKLTEFGQKIALDSNHCLSVKLPPNCCLENELGAENFVSSFVRYEGSLTTPPCSENVIWTVFTDPLLITKEQLSLLRAIKDCRGKLVTKNYRPVQKIRNREVSFWMASSQQPPITNDNGLKTK